MTSENEKCPTCKGRTFMFIKGANGQEQCKTCLGTGLNMEFIPGEAGPEKATPEDLDLP